MTTLSRRDLLRTGSVAAAALTLPASAAAGAASYSDDPFIEICAAMKARMPPGYKLHSMMWSEAGDEWEHFAAAVPLDGSAGPKIFFDGVAMVWGA